MTKRQEVYELINEIDVYSKDGKKYYVFDAGDHRYRNVKSFGPWLRSLSEYIFKDKWSVKEVYYEYGMHTLKFGLHVSGATVIYKLMVGRLLVIDAETGGFDLITDDIFIEDYRLIHDIL